MTPDLNRKIRDTKATIISAVNADVAAHRVPAETVKTLTTTQDIDMVKWILAETIKDADWDGRYFSSTKAWAQQLYIPVLHAERPDYALLNLHPCHINSLVQAIING